MKEAAERIRVLIVDDSPFSRRLTTDMIDPFWFEIVGFADGFRSALEGYRTYSPDVITIDMTGKEMNGIETTRRLMEQEPDARIVILLNENDNPLDKQALESGAKAVLNKPFDSDQLMNVLRVACEADVVDDAFKNLYPNEFITSFSKLMNRFVDEIEVSDIVATERFKSAGISIIVGITGRYSGRMVLDIFPDIAKMLAGKLLKQLPQSTEQISDVMAELADMVAKKASSKLNKEFRGAFLRVSPPAVFTGDKFSIANPSLDLHAWEIKTPFGNIRLSVGFKKEEI